MALAALKIAKELIHEYAQLRRVAYDRTKSLIKAGFTGYAPPKVKDLTADQIKAEKKKLEKWLGSDRGTVRGMRQLEKERQAREEARRERRRQYDRERYERKRQEKGTQARPPRLTDEERRQRHNEQNRQYRQRVKEREAQLQSWIDQQDNPQGWRNMLSGLRKYEIKVKNPEELKAWMKYIQERKHDSEKDKYFFLQWLNEAQSILLNERSEDKEITDPEIIYQLVEDFQKWKSDNTEMVKQFNAWLNEDSDKRDKSKYSSGDLMKVYFGSKDFQDKYQKNREVKK